MIDARRERAYVHKEYGRFHNKIGESVLWFKFDLTSSYDSVYDEAGRKYLLPKAVPVLWINDMEVTEDYSPDGQRPTMRVHFAVSSRTLNEVGIGAEEAHGTRVFDEKPAGKPWWNDRLNDLVYYSGRWYEISDFQIKGRLQGGDVIVGVSAVETQLDDEWVFDHIPTGRLP